MSLLASDFLAPFGRRTAPAARSPLAAPPASRARGRGRKNRLAERLSRRAAPFGMAESLERRLALAVDVDPITGNGFFFVDTGQGRTLDSEYAGYSITNNDPVTYADVWVQAHDFTGGVINLSPNEDGVYHVGQLDPGEVDRAWFYLSATGGSLTPQSHQISVYDGDPREGGTLISGPTTVTFDQVEETQETSSNQVFSVSYDTATPVLGGTLKMTVTGNLGQAGGDSVLFTPDTFNTWRPDVFELETMTIKIDGTNARTVTDELFLTGFAQESDNFYTAVYTFRIVDVIATQTPVSPTQFVGGKTPWKHDQPIGVAFPPVPAVTNAVTLEKLVQQVGSSDPPVSAITIPETGMPTDVEFTLTFTNTSDKAVTLDSIRDTLPPGAVYVAGSAEFGGLPIDDPTIDGNNLAWLGPFVVPKHDGLGTGTATLAFRATIPAATGVYVNSSVGRIGSVQIDTTLDTKDDAPATATVAIAQAADLAVEKETKSAVLAGAEVTYLITVTNNGPTTVTEVTLTDEAVPSLANVAWSGASEGTYNPTTQLWTGLDLAITESVTITLKGTLSGTATGDLKNTVKVKSDIFDPDKTNNTSTVIDTIGAQADLTVKKETKSAVLAGAEVTYLITVTNNGPTTVTEVTLTDEAVPSLANVAWSGASEGTYNPTTQLWTGLDLASTESVTITLKGTLSGTATGDLENTVKVKSDIFDPNTNNNTFTVTDEIGQEADLAVEKETKSAVLAGAEVTYLITVTNNGPTTVTEVTLTDEAVPSLANVAWSGASEGTYNPTTQLWTGLDLAITESVTITLKGTLSGTATGDLENTVKVKSDIFDPNTNNNTFTVTDEIGSSVDLGATKKGDEFYKGGGFLNFNFIVTNSGLSFASGIRVLDGLPAGVVSWTWASGPFTGLGSGVVAGNPSAATNSTDPIDTLIDLAPGGTATFTITALTNADFKSDITNIVVVTLGQVTDTDSWTSEYDGPINPTQDVGALVVTNDDLCFGLPLVRVLDPETGADRITPFLAYEPNFRGSVRVATGDLTGDGIDEIVVAPGPGRVGQIRVFTVDGVELRRYRTFPFGTTYRGGVDVAVGNIDGIGGNEIIASRSSGLSRVNVFGVDPLAGDPVTNWPIRTFIGIPGAYRNGAVVTAGDYGTFTNGVMNTTVADGIDEIAVGSNAGIQAQVRVYDVSASPRQVGSFFAIRSGFRGGVTLSTARWNSDTAEDIIVGAGVGGGSIVEVYGGVPVSRFVRLAAFSSFGRPNAVVNAAALDITGDGIADNLYGVQGRGGSGGTRGVRRFERLTNITSTLPGSTSLAPPLRIAPITLRVLGG